MGYFVKGKEDKVLKLKKALYGLKQAPRAWNSRFNKYFQDNKFIELSHEHSLYTKINQDGDILVVCFYVDEWIFISSDQRMFEEFKEAMAREFDMMDIGLVCEILEPTIPYYMYLFNIVLTLCHFESSLGHVVTLE